MDSRVEPGVGNIRDQIGDDNHRAKNNGNPRDNGVFSARDGIHQQLANAG